MKGITSVDNSKLYSNFDNKKQYCVRYAHKTIVYFKGLAIKGSWLFLEFLLNEALVRC